MGLAGNGTAIEVFVSEAGTFTIVMTWPNGMSCLIAAGKDWQKAPRAEPSFLSTHPIEKKT